MSRPRRPTDVRSAHGTWRTSLADWRLWLAVACTTLLAVLLDVPLADSLVVGLGVLVLGLLASRFEDAEDPAWPAPPQHTTHGRRSEVAAITWSLAGRDGKVAEPAVRRLREVARRRLARAGLPLSAGFVGPADAQGLAERAAARSVLGERAWSALTLPDGRLPSPADVAACVRALEGVLTREESR